MTLAPSAQAGECVQHERSPGGPEAGMDPNVPNGYVQGGGHRFTIYVPNCDLN